MTNNEVTPAMISALRRAMQARGNYWKAFQDLKTELGFDIDIADLECIETADAATIVWLYEENEPRGKP
jgi:hypothetical protein